MDELQIGQHYIRAHRTGRRRVKVHDIVTIVGRVDEDTIEHKDGFRYYSSFGEFFGPLGESYRDPTMGGNQSKGNSKDRNLAYIADDIDLKDGVQERARIEIEDTQRRFPHQYISSLNSDFAAHVGCVYVNRMGFLVLIDRTQTNPHDGNIRYYDHQFGYFKNGKRRGGVKSMRDLILQRV